MSTVKFTPYTYLIGWSDKDLWYYGVRYARGCNPNDLWNPYKTSSKYVHTCIETHGDPDVIQIRKAFNDVDKAREWEHKVLRRIGAIKSKKFINKTDNKAFDPILAGNASKGRVAWNKGKKTGPRTREQIERQNAGKRGMLWWNNGEKEVKSKICPGNDWIRGRVWSPSSEHKKQISSVHIGNSYSKGKHQSIESNIKRSLSLKGRKNTWGDKISEAHKGRVITWNDKIKETKQKNGSSVGIKNPMYGKRGSLSPLKNHRWYNNGTQEVFSKTPPEGYVLGRVKH